MGINVEAKDNLGAKVGEFVELVNSKVSVKKAVMWVYLVPMIGLIIGIILGTLIPDWLGWKMNVEVSQVVGGLIFMVIAYLLVNYVDRNIRKRGGSEFEVIRIVGRD